MRPKLWVGEFKVLSFTSNSNYYPRIETRVHFYQTFGFGKKYCKEKGMGGVNKLIGV